MADYTNPKAQNAILSDLQDIVTLTQTNAKMDPSAQDNIPNGAKRLVTVTGGYQLQTYNGTTWTTIGKLVHDSDTLDSYHANTGTTASTIPVRNTSGVLPGDLAGNAATTTKLNTARTIDIGGIATADATSFDGTTNITIPLNSVTINNDEDDAVNGTLTTAHGGTGRTDGAAADVVVSSGAGTVKASDYGQVGDAKALAADADLNSQVVTGNYTSTSGTVELHYPYAGSSWFLVVKRTSTVIKQLLFDKSGFWTRESTNTGASWSGWVANGSPSASSLTIYVSKSGTDLNTGLDTTYPVLTLDRALQLAKGYASSAYSGAKVKLCVGEGEWGDLSVTSAMPELQIYPYDGTAASVYATTLPVFSSIIADGGQVRVYGATVQQLEATSGGIVFVEGYNRVASFSAEKQGVLSIEADNTVQLEIASMNNHTHVFYATAGGTILFNGARTINIAASLNLIGAFVGVTTGGNVLGLSSAIFTVGDGVNVLGSQYNLVSCYVDADKQTLDALPGTASSGVITKGTRLSTGLWGGGDGVYLAGDGDWHNVTVITDPVVEKMNNGDNELAAQLQQVRVAIVSSNARVAAAEENIATNKENIDFIEEFRRSWIGVPRFYHGKTLPANCMWAERTTFTLGDYPEFKALWDLSLIHI